MNLPSKVVEIIQAHVNRGNDYNPHEMLDEVGQYISIADYRREVLDAALDAISDRTAKQKQRIDRNFYIFNGLLVLAVLFYLVTEVRWLIRVLGGSG